MPKDYVDLLYHVGVRSKQTGFPQTFHYAGKWHSFMWLDGWSNWKVIII